MAIARKRDPLLPLNQTRKIVISTGATRVLCEVAEKETSAKPVSAPSTGTMGRELWEGNNGKGTTGRKQREENNGKRTTEENNGKGTMGREHGKETTGREQWEGHAFTRATKGAPKGATSLPKAGVEASADTTDYCRCFFYSSTHLRSEELRFSTAPSAVAGVPLFATASSSLR
jgi:hypothetical protein